MSGRTVRIFMADGSAFGIRQCEIFNRTIQALAVSRARLGELKDWDEAGRSGVYFLFGKTDEGDQPKVYIGQAQRVIDRVSAHVREKDFWNEVVLFVNKDENINAAYLEARLIAQAGEAGRYVMDNGKGQQNPVLSRADKDAMEEILRDVRLILGVLNHPVLESLDRPMQTSSETQSAPDRKSLVGAEVTFSGPAFDARARITDEGVVILKGSTAAPEFKVGNLGYEKIRQRLVEEGALIAENGRLMFTKDVSANSSSQAASIIAGGNRSGPGSWRLGNKALGELEAEAVDEPNTDVGSAGT